MLPPFFHQTPFFRLLLPFITGIISGYYIEIPLKYNLSLCVLFAIAIICFITLRRQLAITPNYTWIFGILTNVFLLFAGISTVSLKSFTPVETAEQGIWTAIIEEPPIEKAKSMKATMLLKTNTTDSAISCNERIIVYFRKDSLSKLIRQGDLLIIKTTLNPVTNAGNPYEFDYRGYLARKHICRSAFVESGQWQKLDEYAQSPLFNLANRIRNSLLAVLKQAGISGNEHAVASALVLGYKADLDNTLLNAYSSSGAMHVLAVSGLHVGIIYAVLNTLLNLFPFMARRKWLQTSILLAFLWLYALITGLSPSVIRAATMFSFVAAGKAMNRNAYIYNSIAASAFVLLLVNPYIIFEVGFQLSYMAVIAIVVFHPHFYSLLSFNNRIPDYLWSLTCVSITAQIGTAPLSMFYFQQFPPYFILSNFIVIPAAVVIIYGAVLLFTISPITVLLQSVGWLLDKIIFAVNYSIFFIEKLPGSVITGIRFAGWEIISAYALIAAFSTWLLTKHKTALFATLIVAIIWTSGTIVRTDNDLRRQQLIVYNTSRNSLLQFVNGRDNTVWYASDNNTFNIYRFLNSQNTAMQIKNGQYNHLDSVLSIEKERYLTEDLFATGNFVQFAGKRIVIFTRMMPPQNAGQLSITTDVAILTQNVNARISQIIETYNPATIVIDSSNSKARTARWENECAQAGVKCHIVDRDGAFVYPKIQPSFLEYQH